MTPREKELQARVNHLEAALRDFQQYGLRCDLNPTHEFGSTMTIETFWLDYIKRVDEIVRQRAKTALQSQPAHTL